MYIVRVESASAVTLPVQAQSVLAVRIMGSALLVLDPTC